MEPNIEAFLEEECDASRKMFSNQDADLMLQTNGDHDFFTNDFDGGLFLQTHSVFWPVNQGNQNVDGIGGNWHFFYNHDYVSPHNVYQESSNSTASEGASTHLNYAFCNNNFLDYPEEVFEGCIIMEEQNAYFHEVGSDKFENLQGQPLSIADSDDELRPRRKWDAAQIYQAESEEKSICVSPEKPTKKSRVSRNASKCKRNAQSRPELSKMKANEINNGDEEEMTKVVRNGGQGPGSYSSDDNYSVSHDSNGVAASDNKGPALNLNGKTRSSRGSATDPQSLYARTRRERINKRLRILQNLIPNGTKVDISTMLEEAVQYVKLLQLQIKLLNSDDMWMYAPLVYNGINIGLLGKDFLTL